MNKEFPDFEPCRDDGCHKLGIHPKHKVKRPICGYCGNKMYNWRGLKCALCGKRP